MSKLKSIIAAAALVATMPFAMSASVSATDADCTITNTGPGSNNTCTTNNNYRCEVENDNVVVYDSNNQQVAQSGDASGTGNTSGGNATSGSATNSNGTTFNYTVTNEGCTVSSVVTPTPTPTPTAPVGGSGAAGGEAAPVAAKPTVLAKTSGENFAGYVAALIAVLAVAAAGVRSYALLRSR